MAERWRGRGRVAEAAILLITARLLIGWARFGLWRRWLGRIDPAAPPAPQPAPLALRRLVRAIDRAGMRLHYPFKCLPRAMALQWMLRRRGIGSTLVIGIARGLTDGRLSDLHAWVEVAGTVVIGADSTRDYGRCLALTQP